MWVFSQATLHHIIIAADIIGKEYSVPILFQYMKGTQLRTKTVYVAAMDKNLSTCMFTFPGSMLH